MLRASKWLEFQVLIDEVEMQSFMEAWKPASLYQSSAVVSKGKEVVSAEDFLSAYRDYLSPLREGVLPSEALYRPALTLALSVDPSCFDQVKIELDRTLLKVVRPVVQMRPHWISYSAIEEKFRPNAIGNEAIPWGVQFSYPQICQLPGSEEVHRVVQSEIFPNTVIFKQMQQWVRKNTIPTPFQVNGKRINVPMRLGKRCLEWIHRHPVLKQKGISVEVSHESR